MKKILSVLVFSGALVVPALASAATVTNRDDTAHTLVVVEGGNQAELVIEAGQSVDICPSGCFLTMPNGDREVLTGTETLEIQASRGVIVE